MNIANSLTLARILLSPLFLFVYMEHEALHIHLVALPYVLLCLLGISELSDICDGYFARKYNEVTDLGKILDPMADSIYRLSLFLTFTLPPIRLPLLVVFVFLYRDLMISTLRTICALKGFALAARPSGKLKAVVQAFSAFLIVLLLIPYSLGDLTESTLQFASCTIAIIAGAYTLFSGIEYVYAHRHYIKLLSSNNAALKSSNFFKKTSMKSF